MSLTSTGLGIGTTSPSERLDVRGSDPVALVRATNTSGSATLNLQGLASNGSDLAVSQLKSVSEGASPAASMTFSTRNSVGTTAEQARITSSGAWSFGSSGTATGTSGQVLTSAGSGAAPTWSTPTGVTTGKSIAMAMIFGF